MDELQILDIKILKFLNSVESASISQISSKLSVNARKRVELLINKNLVAYERSPIEIEDGKIVPTSVPFTGCCLITELGRIAIQNHVTSFRHKALYRFIDFSVGFILGVLASVISGFLLSHL